MTTEELMTNLLSQVQELAKRYPSQEDDATDGLLRFTAKEIRIMPNSFKNTFRAHGCTAHVRKRADKRYKCSYEIRYRRDGYNISVSATTLAAAKERFIAAVAAAPTPNHAVSTVPTQFAAFAEYYFDTFRWRTVAAKTKRNDYNRYKLHIAPYFGAYRVKDITPGMCQSFVDSLSDRPKTAHECLSLLRQTFKMAIRHGIIAHNPCDVVFIRSYEKVHGSALTRAEEKQLLEATKGTRYQVMFAVALYTGVRPNEYKTVRIEGKFIVARNSKQKDGKEHFKRIPVCPMLAPYISEDVAQISFAHVDTLAQQLKNVLPLHTLKDMRTTFYSRCEECNVNPTAKKLFVGHSLGALESAYTDVSDDFLISECEKIHYSLD